MLPAGLWFDTKDTYALTEDRSWQEAALRQKDASVLLQLLQELGGQAEGKNLRAAVPDEEAFEKAVGYLLRKKWITAQRDFLSRASDKTEKIATLVADPQQAMEFARTRPKSAAAQRSVLELMCAVGSGAVKEICYFTGAKPATVKRLAELGYLELSHREVLRCSQIKPIKLSGPLELNEEQVARLYNDFVEMFRVSSGMFIGQITKAVEHVLDPEDLSEESITHFVCTTALNAGLAKLLTEKLINIQNESDMSKI